MKVIFLDFDGVLNSHAWWELRPKPFVGIKRSRIDDLEICPENIRQLNAIVSETGAKVVVSSTWRLTRTVKELRDILHRNGFIGDVIDKTPVLPSRRRGLEIQDWIDNNCKDCVFVILDDDSDMEHLLPFLVKTSLFSGGLKAEHVQKAVEVLNGKLCDC